MSSHLRLVGDVHGNIASYISLVKEIPYSIQLGDLGFKYKPWIYDLSADQHKVLAGNHDNYDLEDGIFANQTEHFLGDYGVHTVPDIGNLFFIRGGNSIDRYNRIAGLSWWPDEELSYEKCQKALDLYSKLKPDMVISHECPESVIKYVSGLNHWNGKPIPPSVTSMVLQYMFEKHQPKLWFFGHHHKSWTMMIDGTQFRCLNELEVYDIPKGGLL